MKTTKKLSIAGLITLFCGYGSAFAGSLISPVTSNLMGELSGAPEFWINFVVSGAALVALVFNFITGFASQFISKRKLQLIGNICFCVGGIGLVFARGLVAWAICRSLIGVSSGIVCITIPAIICEEYVDIKMRSRYLGIYNFVGCALGMAFSFGAGIIATSTPNWHSVFWLNAISIVGLLGTLFLVPDNGASGKKAKEEKEVSQAADTGKFNLPFCIVLLIGQALAQALFCVVYYLIDLYVVETGIGNAALTGTFSAIGTAAAAIISVVFGVVYMKLRRWTAPISWLLVAIPYMLLSMKTNSVVFVILGAIMFAANSIAYVYYMTKISELAPPSKSAMLMTANSVVCSGGMYLSPFIPSLVKALFGAETMQASFLYIGLAMLICGIISIILIFVMKDSHDKPQAAAKEA